MVQQLIEPSAGEASKQTLLLVGLLMDFADASPQSGVVVMTGCLPCAVGNEDDWAAGVCHHMLTHRAEQRPDESATASGSDNQRRRVLGSEHECLRRMSRDPPVVLPITRELHIAALNSVLPRRAISALTADANTCPVSPDGSVPAAHPLGRRNGEYCQAITACTATPRNRAS
jgi:hypothetical protein